MVEHPNETIANTAQNLAKMAVEGLRQYVENREDLLLLIKSTEDKSHLQRYLKELNWVFPFGINDEGVDHLLSKIDGIRSDYDQLMEGFD